ncbi:hypothetical protein P2L57_22610 [Streptomyces ferralitis]|uniref:SAF domain-containing protein n=1 Tax=Streptantibioticus ferralitis TaxID=236510 RepID=A0ABT5Z3K7_9ACTN|nr:hypothetical protein [Streptantibioticus ferralitis]
MKTKEGTAAGGGANRAVPPAVSVGERLPVAPRERKPALAALAVLLILVGALGATVLVLRAGNKTEAIKVTERVAAGQTIPASAMTEVDVASGTGVNYVQWAQRNALSNYRAATDILPNTPIVGEMLTQDKGLANGKVIVGLSLKDGQYPSGLSAGDTVAAYRVGTDSSKASSANSGTAAGTGSTSTSGGGNNLITANARVQSATPPSGNTIGSGDLPVTLVVNQSDAAALTQAASAGQVALVVVPGNASGN